ncbi:amidohydrolase family protein [Paraferrimonas haliotis]|uniref:Bifunctional TolB-family protein/amidohydrolase n=1 Tax=Paraferrimonas haliotis TaxID=2013866 RepID=A0AA37WXU9_9GAMM|nr:amidohydrolase family protein [Paraferrimonas haliotis]GLS84813.1 bifunctional TolB-family protein/amidohydrolase [Paraferrimonas haliotis]
MKKTLTSLCIAAALCLPATALQAAEESAWDVNNPKNAPLETISIDTKAGTWMNVSLSPDGKTIVFDLLGDIYSMPAKGGEAKPLLKGIAWHMQPVFSPDGKSIAFTSDQGGGDNIWVMNADGSDVRAVTDETFRLLNSPAWSPDSQYLIARKHFTGTRSLGAGEVWMYHVQGGSGVRLTERPNEQKDLGEPAFSPDGRYVYFSQDATPGKTFHYSKDSVKGIYKIKRYDRQTGEIEVLIEGTGGAIRPTPSPDGKRLAYIKRDGFQSTLYVMDLASGNHKKVTDKLDRDMQETWAIHGVYPTMAWTPDNKEILFWGQGKIQKVIVDKGNVEQVPFHVSVEKKIQPAVKFKQNIDKDVFDVKMLRQAQVSPNGKQVVFESLGKLWIKDLPNGKAKRLTKLDDNYDELWPQWSRDSKSIVFASWNDQEQGAIRIATVRNGRTSTLTKEPGKYVEPTFSPDGNTVVYRKARGGYLLPKSWSQDPGLYKVAVKKGNPQRISNSGFQPQFGADNDRVYFMEGGKEQKLSSIGLDGYEPRTHYKSALATEFRVSPDGKHLAFAERFKVFVTPFAKHGETISIGPGANNLPVRQLSTRAGESISWGGDNSSLHWTLGPELYSAKVDLNYASEQSESSQQPKIVNIGYSEKSYVPRGTIAFTGGQVITMDGDKVYAKGTVVVQDNKIVAVGDETNTRIPADATIIDITGKTVMPGLFDAHAHGGQGRNEIIPQQNWINYAGLALGVTSIHDPSNDTTEIFAASERQKAGKIVGPRIFSTGTILYGAHGAGYTSHVDSLEDAKFHLERLQKVGAFSVKSYNQPRRNQRQQVIEAARELEMMVVPEGGSLLQHNLSMISDGHTTIEHSLPVAAVYSDIEQFWNQSKTGYTPTLVVAYGGISGEHYWYDKTDVWTHPRLSKYVPNEILNARSMRRTTAPDEHYNHFNVARVAEQLRKVGVVSAIGAHGQRESLGAHWEIWMFEQGGMSPLEALKTATINPAIHFAMDHQLGSLTPGKLADIIVIDGDPLKDIRQSDRVTHTMVNGRLFDAESMNELNGDKQKRKPFYFE